MPPNRATKLNRPGTPSELPITTEGKKLGTKGAHANSEQIVKLFLSYCHRSSYNWAPICFKAAWKASTKKVYALPTSILLRTNNCWRWPSSIFTPKLDQLFPHLTASSIVWYIFSASLALCKCFVRSSKSFEKTKSSAGSCSHAQMPWSRILSFSMSAA